MNTTAKQNKSTDYKTGMKNLIKAKQNKDHYHSKIFI